MQNRDVDVNTMTFGPGVSAWGKGSGGARGSGLGAFGAAGAKAAQQQQTVVAPQRNRFAAFGASDDGPASLDFDSSRRGASR